jgi:molecular chaperone GrpE
VSQQDTSNTVNQDAPETLPEAEIESPAPADAQKPADVTTPEPSAELLAAQQQAQEYLAGWQRERAEFANYKKRTEREMKDLSQNAAVAALVGLLPIIDDFERAMSNVPADFKDNPWMNGITAIHRKFQKILDDRGVTIVDPTGEPFDPTCHEAVATEDSSEVESGRVTVTLQKGYVLGDRVLRPALVRVAN